MLYLITENDRSRRRHTSPLPYNNVFQEGIVMINLDKVLNGKDAALEKMNDVVTNVLATTKLNEILHKEEPKPEKKTKGWVIALAVVGAIAAVATISYCVYRFMFPEYIDDFDDEELEEEEEGANA